MAKIIFTPYSKPIFNQYYTKKMTTKIKKTLSLTLVACSLASATLMAQTTSINNISRISLNNIEAIVENDEVKGYSAFYLVDKKSSKEKIFKIAIYDNNMVLKYDIDLIQPSKVFYLESSYNGKVFAFKFFNAKENRIEILTYNKEGKKIGTFIGDEIEGAEIYAVQAALSNNSAYGTMESIKDKGFITISTNAEYRYQTSFVAIDENGKKIWTKSFPGLEKKDPTSAIILNSGTKLSAAIVYCRKNAYTMALNNAYLSVFDNATGKTAFEFNFINTKYQYMPYGVTFEDNNILMYGEYFNKTDNMYKDASQGLCLLKLDNTGKIIAESYNNWKTDVSKVIPADMKLKFDVLGKVAVQNLVKTSDGKYFLVCEQFKRVADGVGIALTALAGNNGSASVTKIQILNMAIIEFNADFKVQNCTIVEKDKGSVSLPVGYDYLGSTFIATYLKGTKQFDYAYTSTSIDKKSFNVGYVNYDREKGKGNSNYIIGNINYTDGAIVTNKISLKNKPTSFIALPAKPGYSGIFEYYAKEARVDLRLEKLNF